MALNAIKIILLVVFLTNILQQAMACTITHKYKIQVISRLPYNSYPLVLHCASRDDELGTRTLDVGMWFDWEFCENFFPNTLYFCHLWWGPRDRAFNVFISKHSNACKSYECIWIANSDGIYYQDGASGELKKKYDWIG